MHSILGESGRREEEDDRGDGGEERGNEMAIDRSRMRGEWSGDEDEDEDEEEELERERGVDKVEEEIEPSRSESSSK